jgi:AcrR family transcriptional regulator
VQAAKAAATRRAILRAARELLTADGYGCTVAQVADRAGVAVDTVYASAGRKPELILAVIDMVLGEADEPVPVGEREYVLRIQAAATAEQKIAVYADALSTLLPSVAPLQEALRQAGQSEPECARAWTRLVERRAANMLLFARELRGPGELRSDLDDPSSPPTGWGIFRTGAGIAADRTQFTRTIVDSATRCPVSGRERARTCSSASSASAT